MTLTEETVNKIVRQILAGQDYRFVILDLINEDFLRYVIDFFKKVVDAKLNEKEVNADWYRAAFIDAPNLNKEEVVKNAGINVKTVNNMYGSFTKSVAIHAAQESYEKLVELIDGLVDQPEDGIDVQLAISLNEVSVTLSVSESLVVINALAVGRAAMRGGYWSAAGKGVEGPLMESLCRIYKVPTEYYNRHDASADDDGKVSRESDFHLLNGDKRYKCEVKLMGKGNPESADSAFARGTNVFVADKLSDTGKNQLDQEGVKWVEFRGDGGVGIKKFGQILKELRIPHSTPDENATHVEDVDAACRTYFSTGGTIQSGLQE